MDSIIGLKLGDKKKLARSSSDIEELKYFATEFKNLNGKFLFHSHLLMNPNLPDYLIIYIYENSKYLITEIVKHKNCPQIIKLNNIEKYKCFNYYDLTIFEYLLKLKGNKLYNEIIMNYYLLDKLNEEILKKYLGLIIKGFEDAKVYISTYTISALLEKTASYVTYEQIKKLNLLISIRINDDIYKEFAYVNQIRLSANIDNINNIDFLKAGLDGLITIHSNRTLIPLYPYSEDQILQRIAIIKNIEIFT